MLTIIFLVLSVSFVYSTDFIKNLKLDKHNSAATNDFLRSVLNARNDLEWVEDAAKDVNYKRLHRKDSSEFENEDEYNKRGLVYKDKYNNPKNSENEELYENLDYEDYGNNYDETSARQKRDLRRPSEKIRDYDNGQSGVILVHGIKNMKSKRERDVLRTNESIPEIECELAKQALTDDDNEGQDHDILGLQKVLKEEQYLVKNKNQSDPMRIVGRRTKYGLERVYCNHKNSNRTIISSNRQPKKRMFGDKLVTYFRMAARKRQAIYPNLSPVTKSTYPPPLRVTSLSGVQQASPGFSGTFIAPAPIFANPEQTIRPQVTPLISSDTSQNSRDLWTNVTTIISECPKLCQNCRNSSTTVSMDDYRHNISSKDLPLNQNLTIYSSKNNSKRHLAEAPTKQATPENMIHNNDFPDIWQVSTESFVNGYAVTKPIEKGQHINKIGEYPTFSDPMLKKTKPDAELVNLKMVTINPRPTTIFRLPNDNSMTMKQKVKAAMEAKKLMDVDKDFHERNEPEVYSEHTSVGFPKEESLNTFGLASSVNEPNFSEDYDNENNYYDYKSSDENKESNNKDYIDNLRNNIIENIKDLEDSDDEVPRSFKSRKLKSYNGMRSILMNGAIKLSEGKEKIRKKRAGIVKIELENSTENSNNSDSFNVPLIKLDNGSGPIVLPATSETPREVPGDMIIQMQNISKDESISFLTNEKQVKNKVSNIRKEILTVKNGADEPFLTIKRQPSSSNKTLVKIDGQDYVEIYDDNNRIEDEDNDIPETAMQNNSTCRTIENNNNISTALMLEKGVRDMLNFIKSNTIDKKEYLSKRHELNNMMNKYCNKNKFHSTMKDAVNATNGENKYMYKNTNESALRENAIEKLMPNKIQNEVKNNNIYLDKNILKEGFPHKYKFNTPSTILKKFKTYGKVNDTLKNNIRKASKPKDINLNKNDIDDLLSFILSNSLKRLRLLSPIMKRQKMMKRNIEEASPVTSRVKRKIKNSNFELLPNFKLLSNFVKLQKRELDSSDIEQTVKVEDEPDVNTKKYSSIFKKLENKEAYNDQARNEVSKETFVYRRRTLKSYDDLESMIQSKLVKGLDYENGEGSIMEKKNRIKSSSKRDLKKYFGIGDENNYNDDVEDYYSLADTNDEAVESNNNKLTKSDDDVQNFNKDKKNAESNYRTQSARRGKMIRKKIKNNKAKNSKHKKKRHKQCKGGTCKGGRGHARQCDDTTTEVPSLEEMLESFNEDYTDEDCKTPATPSTTTEDVENNIVDTTVSTECITESTSTRSTRSISTKIVRKKVTLVSELVTTVRAKALKEDFPEIETMDKKNHRDEEDVNCTTAETTTVGDESTTECIDETSENIKRRKARQKNSLQETSSTLKPDEEDEDMVQTILHSQNREERFAHKLKKPSKTRKYRTKDIIAYKRRKRKSNHPDLRHKRSNKHHSSHHHHHHSKGRQKGNKQFKNKRHHSRRQRKNLANFRRGKKFAVNIRARKIRANKNNLHKTGSIKEKQKLLKHARYSRDDVDQLKMVKSGEMSSHIVDNVFAKLDEMFMVKGIIEHGLNKNHHPVVALTNLEQFKTQQNEEDIKHTEEMLHVIMNTINNIISEQVNKKTCQSLEPTQKDYLLWETEIQLSPATAEAGYPLQEVRVNYTEPKQDNYLFGAPESGLKHSEHKDPVQLKMKKRKIKEMLKKYHHLSPHEKRKYQAVKRFLRAEIAVLDQLIIKMKNQRLRETKQRKMEGSEKYKKLVKRAEYFRRKRKVEELRKKRKVRKAEKNENEFEKSLVFHFDASK